MTCILEKSTRHFLWRIRTLTLIISIVFVFGSTPVFARGGEGTPAEDTQVVVIQADMVVALAARQVIMGFIPAVSMDGSQAARRRMAIP